MLIFLFINQILFSYSLGGLGIGTTSYVEIIKRNFLLLLYLLASLKQNVCLRVGGKWQISRILMVQFAIRREKLRAISMH